MLASRNDHAINCPFFDEASFDAHPNPEHPDTEWVCDGCGAVIATEPDDPQPRDVKP